MKWKRKLLIALAVVAVVAGVAFVARSRARKDTEPPGTEVVKAGRFVVKIRETGVLEPLYSVQVKSNVEGEIRGLFVREGDTVHKGDLLIQLDDEAIRQERRQADANLRSAQAEAERAERNVHLTDVRQEALLSDAEDGVDIALAALDAARRTTTHQVTSAALEVANTENGLAQDRIALNQAHITLKQAELGFESARSRLASAAVTRVNAEAELQRLRELHAKSFVSKSQVEKAETERASAETQFEQAEKDVAAHQEAVRGQEEAVRSRERTLEYRQQTLGMQRTNVETLKSARAAVEKQAVLQFDTARTNLAQVQDTMEAELANSQSSLDVAEANRLRVESTLKNAQQRVDWTSIVAPMSGTIIDLQVEEGEIVQSGRFAFSQAVAVMTIADLSQMVIRTAVNEVDIPRISVGQKVEIRSDAYRERVFGGRVKEISPRAEVLDNVTKFEVLIEVQGSPPELRPGMNGDVDVIVADRESVVQLPIETLIETTKMVVELPVPEGELDGLEAGQEVDVESRSGKRFPGRITTIDLADQMSVVVFIEDDAPQGLRAGDRTVSLVVGAAESGPVRTIADLEAHIVSERKELVLRPAPEPKARYGLSFLRHIRGAKKPESQGVEQQIKVGLRNDTAFEVADGLEVGDEVVVPELSRLIPSAD